MHYHLRDVEYPFLWKLPISCSMCMWLSSYIHLLAGGNPVRFIGSCMIASIPVNSSQVV